MQELAEEVWRERERAHVTRVEDLVAAHLHRRRSGRKHPVEDFLWVYYSYRPGQLRRWHPGPGVTLRRDRDPTGRRSWKHYAAIGDGTIFDAASFRRDRGDTVAWISELLSATAARQPTYSCFGLHEWAMIYRSREGERRHEQLPLRVSQAEADAVVAAAQIRCSHFDAYRFFTPPAVPLNELRPSRATQAEHEQPGCLHASMDLYKWAMKLSPAVPSELALDCLDLALTARRLDMAASPYDVRPFGLEPVPVETAEGRAAYVARQREIVARGTELRARLVNACQRLRAIT